MRLRSGRSRTFSADLCCQMVPPMLLRRDSGQSFDRRPRLLVLAFGQALAAVLFLGKSGERLNIRNSSLKVELNVTDLARIR